jgi:hypothetical protein
MPADTSLRSRTPQDKAGNDGQALAPAIRRAALLPALTGARGADGPPREAALLPGAAAGLLDYADFVLDQEARYCQQ